ncbi:MAG TPA: hypothetical protein VK168_14225 [Saprospiraceae bacterium]|nr:hypothetical protein [Saprospiraceae bacterium]
MKKSFPLMLGLMISLFCTIPVYALEAPAQVVTEQHAYSETSPSETKAKMRKSGGFFKQLRAVKAMKKVLKQMKSWVQEQSANKGKIALGLFIGAIILFSLGTFISSVLLYAGLIAFLASDILSFVILATEEDPKSKKIAKTILWASLVLVLIAALLALLAYVLLIAFFAALF